MEPEQTKTSKNLVLITVALALIILLLVGIIGWLMGRDKSTEDTAPDTTLSDTTSASPPASAGRVTDLVEFDVPGGWKQATCNNAENITYFIPSSLEPDCSSKPNFSITLAVDPQNNTDCNQLQNVQDVSKHICRSIFIDNHKTLEATTVYTQDSGVLPGRTVDAYYLDTGRGVIAARYVYSSQAEYGTVFNNLVKGLRVRR